jgi:hypothetical protein
MSSLQQIKQDLIDRSLNTKFIGSFHHQFLNLKLGFNHNNEIKKNGAERRTKSKGEENNIFYILFFRF